MKSDEVKIAAQRTMVLERIAMFDAGIIQSITVQANMHSAGPERGNTGIAIRVDPSDARFTTLETILKAEAAKQKTDAEEALAAVNVTVEVDPALVAAARDEAVKAKAQHDDLVERNRQKRILAEALEADKAKKDK